MKHIRMILLTLAMIPLAACALSGEAIEGRVLEEGTNKPIPGAIVVVRWKGRVSSFVDSQGVCYHVETATTDEQGNYQTKAWSQPRDYLVSFDYIAVDAYKPGYSLPRQPLRTTEVRYLAPSKGTREERLKFLLRTSSGTQCNAAGKSEKNMLPLGRALYDEARSIALTTEDQKSVEILLFGLESLQYGSMEALKRMNERRGGD